MTSPTTPNEPTAPSQSAPPSAPPAPRRSPNSGFAILGAILVLLGVFFLVEQVIGQAFTDRWWPVLVMIPGIALLAVGLVPPNVGMVIGGTVVTTVGSVLLYQNETGSWATWAYAWALVGPAASGFGQLLGGWRTGNSSMARSGGRTMLVGLLLFTIGYLFFEQVLGLTGEPAGIPPWVLPAVLIGAGMLVLVGALRRSSTQPEA